MAQRSARSAFAFFLSRRTKEGRQKARQRVAKAFDVAVAVEAENEVDVQLEVEINSKKTPGSWPGVVHPIKARRINT
jgi:hypothetical protein